MLRRKAYIPMMSEPIGAGGATILVVDDDALITLNTVDVLSDLGHTALEAYSGREALAILEQRPTWRCCSPTIPCRT